MGILPSSVKMLVKEVVRQGNRYNIFYKSGTASNGTKYSISLFQDAATKKFVNGSYKRVQDLNGCRNTWRQDLFVTKGHGTRTYPFGRISGKESVENAITPRIAEHYFYDPIRDGGVKRLFPKQERIITNSGQVSTFTVEQAIRDIEMNPTYFTNPYLIL